ncbi:MAG: GTPase [Clostridium sp.]|nr:GTPase [Clostridium sp.]
MEEEKMPLFLINGFLEAGKTQFIRFTLQQEYFRTEGRTLLLVCEEGEEEYDEAFLRDTRTDMVVIDDQETVTPEYLSRMAAVYRPERVLMEWNGMWDITKLALPDDWDLYQQITIVDGSTFDLYIGNNDLKSLLGVMVRSTEMLIMNRCDGIEDKLGGYYRILKGMNTAVDIVFEKKEGEIQNVVEEELPYDVTADVIEIPPEGYGIWYIDAFDKPERYSGKTVEFTAMVLKRPEFPANDFVPGRMAMTCCAADMSFLGFMCKAKNGRKLKNRDWVRVRARVEYEYRPEFGGDAPMLYADYVEPAKPIEDIVQF